MGYPGPKSDIKLFQEHKNIFSKEQTFSGDKAYIGDEQMTTPQKKPKNGELTSSQREENKKLSSQRIFVEHIIRLVKVFQVGRDRFRLRVARYKSIILTLCGLVRLHLCQANLVSLKGRDRIFDSLTLRVNRAEENALNPSQFFEELLGLDSSNSDTLVFEEEIFDCLICDKT